MAVSRSLRFQILRRDNHSCRYCGGTAPSATLTVDHVVPVALGGTDDPTNLVTACQGCNAGKSATPPDAPLVADVARDALRWKEAREQAAQLIENDQLGLDLSVNIVAAAWEENWAKATTRMFPCFPGDWETSIRTWIVRGLPTPTMIRLIDVAIAKYLRAGSMTRMDVWPYYAGCCWRSLTEIEAKAQGLIKQGGV